MRKRELSKKEKLLIGIYVESRKDNSNIIALVEELKEKEQETCSMILRELKEDEMIRGFYISADGEISYSVPVGITEKGNLFAEELLDMIDDNSFIGKFKKASENLLNILINFSIEKIIDWILK